MATTVAEAFVTLRPDLKGFEQEAQSSIGGTMRRIGETAAGFLAANVFANALGGVRDFVGGSIQAASDLEQSIGGVQSVFGDSADQILEWGKTADQQFGLSRNAFNELVSPMGAMLKNAGFSMEEVADRTFDLAEKGADLAATFGGPVDQAMNAIASLMRGESNPIERYGVSILQTDVNMRALADTGKATTEELTRQELATARLDLLFEQTADSVGQFAREEDTAAGKVERQRAAQENLAAELGEKLLPVQIKITEAKLAFVRALSDHVIPAIGKVSGVFGFLGDNMGIVAPIIAGLGATIATAIIPSVIAWTAAAWANVAAHVALAAATIAAHAPLLLIAAAVGGLVAGIVLLVRHWDDITARFPILGTVAEAVGATLRSFADWITGSFLPVVQSIASTVTDAVESAVGFVETNWPRIQALIEPAMQAVALVIQTTWDNIRVIFETAFGVIQGALDVFIGVFTGDWDRAWNGVKQIAQAAWDGIVALIGNSIELIKGLVPIMLDAGRALIHGLWDGALAVAADLFNWMRNLGGDVAAAVGDLGMALWQAGVQLIQGLIGGIGSMVGNAVSAVKNAVGGVVSGAMSALGIRSPSTVFHHIGTQVMAGLSSGLLDAGDKVVSDAISIMDNLVNGMDATLQTGFEQSVGTLKAKAMEIAEQVSRSTNEATRSIAGMMHTFVDNIDAAIVDIDANFDNWLASIVDEYLPTAAKNFAAVAQSAGNAFRDAQPEFKFALQWYIETVKRTGDAINASLQLLPPEFQDIAVRMGQALVGGLEEGTSGLQPYLRSVADAIARWGDGIVNEMTDAFKKALEISAAIAANTGPVLGGKSPLTAEKMVRAEDGSLVPASFYAKTAPPSPHITDSPVDPKTGLTKAQMNYIDYMNRVQGMATGGIVRARPGGTLIRAGEGGEDEAVIPLSKMGGGLRDVYGNLQLVLPNVRNSDDLFQELGRVHAW